MRLGIAGAGGIARVHLAAATELGIPATLFARSEEARHELLRAGHSAVGSFDELLSVSDLVVIATPPTSHVRLVHHALGRGVDVLCEKPVALSAAEILDLGHGAGRSNARWWPAHVVRFDPAYLELKRLVELGRLGEPISIELSRRNQAPPLGSWFWDEHASGGVVADLMIHDIDVAVWVFGPVRRVFAADTVTESAAARAILEHVSGATSLLVADWVVHPVAFESGYRVLGTGGTALYSSAAQHPSTFAGPGSDRWAHALRHTRDLLPYVAQLEAVMAACEAGTTPPAATLADVLSVAGIVEAARRSSETRDWAAVA